jgi:hypothetical protein
MRLDKQQQLWAVMGGQCVGKVWNVDVVTGQCREAVARTSQTMTLGTLCAGACRREIWSRRIDDDDDDDGLGRGIPKSMYSRAVPRDVNDDGWRFQALGGAPFPRPFLSGDAAARCAAGPSPGRRAAWCGRETRAYGAARLCSLGASVL